MNKTYYNQDKNKNYLFCHCPSVTKCNTEDVTSRPCLGQLRHEINNILINFYGMTVPLMSYNHDFYCV